MKTLNTLIKLRKQHVDSLRQMLGDLEAQVDELEALSTRLDQQLQDEMDNAYQHIEMRGFFGNFADRIRRRKLQIAEDCKELEHQIQELRDRITDAFAEQKKFEILAERRELEAKKAEAKAETNQMDEIAGQAAARRKEE